MSGRLFAFCFTLFFFFIFVGILSKYLLFHVAYIVFPASPRNAIFSQFLVSEGGLLCRSYLSFSLGFTFSFLFPGVIG